MYNEIDGDLIELALASVFDVVAHGCNCFNTMGAGIALQMAKTFGCDKFQKENQFYKGKIDKLGTIDYKKYYWDERTNEIFQSGDILDLGANRLFVVNAYTQFMYGTNHTDGVSKPLDYEALTLCLRKINHTFKGKHIGLPQIGAGIAAGDWNRIKTIIQQELKDCDVTVVIYNK